MGTDHWCPRSMGGLGPEELARWYFVLRSPVRLRILRLLGERGPLPFKELRRELGMGVGTIYYHLSVMSDLVAQDGKRRYYLTEAGLRLFTALRDGTLYSIVGGPSLAERVLKAVLLAPLFKLACGKPKLGLPLALAIVFFGALGCSRAGLMPVLLFYAKTTTAGGMELFFHYLGQWLVIFLICEGLCLAFFRRFGAELELMIGVDLASLPTAFFPYLYIALPYDVSAKLLPLLQLWSILLICSAISLGKGVRLDRAVPIGLILMSLNIIVLSFLGLLAV
ncbi:hypothetical protein DRO33_01845 [Candidatus Bathyarchaeota archaeon]|nr:MAG: hypothetical protein DRO33_01845 [Candidatus Bathyarchaeota archaeon]